MPIIGYANGVPVYDSEDEVETRAIVHDPHSGQFTSGGGSAGGAQKPKMPTATAADHVKAAQEHKVAHAASALANLNHGGAKALESHSNAAAKHYDAHIAHKITGDAAKAAEHLKLKEHHQAEATKAMHATGATKHSPETASKVAHAASALAKASDGGHVGQNSMHHKAAADYHAEAAEAHKATGNKAAAKEHSDAAKGHKAAARGLKSTAQRP